MAASTISPHPRTQGFGALLVAIALVAGVNVSTLLAQETNATAPQTSPETSTDANAQPAPENAPASKAAEATGTTRDGTVVKATAVTEPTARKPVPEKVPETTEASTPENTPPATDTPAIAETIENPAAPEQPVVSDTATESTPVVEQAEPAKTEPAQTAPAKTETAEKPAPDRVPEPPKILRVATWGGAYRQAQRVAVFNPFSNVSGIRIAATQHTGGEALLKPAAREDLAWDLASVPWHVAEAACRDGAIAAIDADKLVDRANTPVDPDDFLPQALRKCSVGGSVWSSLIAFDRSRFRGRAPTRIEDFFDTATFTGKRGLPRHPRYVVEMALMADGVAVDEVYRELETEAGVNRAFAKLDTIRKDILWLASAREPVSLLTSRKVSMAIGFSGRFFTETAGRDTSIDLLWDGQIYDLDVWVIPKSTTHMPTALKFLSFAVRPDVMAQQARLLPYGPSRRSAARQVGHNETLGIDLSRFLPTAEQNFSRALQVDEAWWTKNGVRLVERFRVWSEPRTADTAQ